MIRDMGRLTVSLALFGIVVFAVVMAAVQVPIYIANLPDSRAGLGWLTVLIVIPTIVAGIVSGLTAALGAHIGKRTSTSPLPTTNMAIGGGLGGSVGSLAYLLYLSWMYQNGLGLWILVLGYVGVFTAFAGFTAFRVRRSAKSGGMREQSSPTGVEFSPRR